MRCQPVIPWPEEWLEFCRGVYDVRTPEEVFDSPWMKLFWADVRQKIRGSSHTVCGEYKDSAGGGRSVCLSAGTRSRRGISGQAEQYRGL